MKKLLAITLLSGLATLAQATVTLDFNVGFLTNADGTTLIANGKLIQIVAAPTTGDFMAPTPTTFTSGSEILLWSGAFNSATASLGAGAMTIAPSAFAIATLPAGYALKLQWFPTLDSTALTPGNSTPYGLYIGQFSPDATTITNIGTDIAWNSPADTNTVSYNLFTISTGLGGIANSVGVANLTTAAIPEPSTYAAIFGALALGFVAYRRRQQAA
ncbi:MAG: PEP-CTERM sorting domain-containing protein [Lacunisphaera sp.]|nr:PEP-CTERM sorting domain-containing protein [Lacunisphaera sp.]